MHYALLLQIIRHNGLGHILDRQCSGPRVRKLLSAVVLATDMSVHFEFMKNFTSLVEGGPSSLVKRTTLICQALIKCADISNPVRRHDFLGLLYLKCTTFAEPTAWGIATLGERFIGRMDLSGATGETFPSSSNCQTVNESFRRSKFANFLYQ